MLLAFLTTTCQRTYINASADGLSPAAPVILYALISPFFTESSTVFQAQSHTRELLLSRNTTLRMTECCPHWHSFAESRSGAEFLNLVGGGPILKGGLGDGSSQAGSRGTAYGGGLRQSPQKLKKHCKLYTFEKYIVSCHTWCSSQLTVVLHKLCIHNVSQQIFCESPNQAQGKRDHILQLKPHHSLAKIMLPLTSLLQPSCYHASPLI